MSSILSIDYGLKRIGIAFSDSSRTFAFAYGVIENKGKNYVFSEIKKIIDEKESKLIIVGMPFNMDNSKGEMARQVEDFILKLKKELEMEIIPVDERLSSFLAEEKLKETQIKGRKLKGKIDAEAARLILEDYLISINC